MLDQIPPWYLSSVFATPQFGSVTVASTVTPIVPADGTRWLLMIGFSQQTGGAQISIDPNLKANTGLIATPSVPPLTMTPQTHGPLVQMAWYGQGVGGSSVPVYFITVSTLAWPKIPGQKVVLPWQEQDQAEEERQVAMQKAEIARLAQRLRKCDSLSDRWLSNLIRQSEG